MPRAALHIVNGVVALGILGLITSAGLLVARACGAAQLLWMPDPWCPAALCVDCSQGGGWPLCLEAGGAGECGMVLATLAGAALLTLGVVASVMLTWQLLLLGAAAALERAQKMVRRGQGRQGVRCPSPPRFARQACCCQTRRAKSGGYSLTFTLMRRPTRQSLGV
jgi:hypothetical protein